MVTFGPETRVDTVSNINTYCSNMTKIGISRQIFQNIILTLQVW